MGTRLYSKSKYYSKHRDFPDWMKDGDVDVSKKKFIRDK